MAARPGKQALVHVGAQVANFKGTVNREALQCVPTGGSQGHKSAAAVL